MISKPDQARKFVLSQISLQRLNNIEEQFRPGLKCADDKDHASMAIIATKCD